MMSETRHGGVCQGEVGPGLEWPDLRQQVLARAMREFKAWQHRYQDYAELAKVFTAAAKVKVPA